MHFVFQKKKKLTCKKTPFFHSNFPSGPGKSVPRRSIISVCSDKLILVTLCPVTEPRVQMRVVFPTPGGPSKTNKATNNKNTFDLKFHSSRCFFFSHFGYLLRSL